MSMAELKVRCTGIAGLPLLMHNQSLANPMDRYVKALKPLTSKRNKTDEDLIEIARIEWEGSLYLRDGVVVMPADNLDKCLEQAAKKTKNGPKYKVGVMMAEDYFVLKYRGPQIKVKETEEIPIAELDKYFEALRHQQLVRVGQQRILRTRAIFHDWSFEPTIMYDPQVIDLRNLISILADAGKFIGLCEKRPRLGRFETEKM